MKLFSRKSLVAGAAAIALATSSMTAPVNADEAPTTFVVAQAADDENTDPGNGTEDPTNPGDNDDDDNGDGGTTDPGDGDDNLSSGSSDVDTDEVLNWVKVITAVIGIFSAVLTFANNLDRYMN